MYDLQYYLSLATRYILFRATYLFFMDSSFGLSKLPAPHTQWYSRLLSLRFFMVNEVYSNDGQELWSNVNRSLLTPKSI